MAVLKNDRNELLYSASSRVTGAVANVTSGVVSSLIVPKNTSTPVPASISLTANVSGYIAPAYAWKYKFSNDVGYTNLGATTSTINVTTDSAYLTLAGANTGVEYVVTVSETTANIGVNQTTAAKFFPILREGADGFNSASLVLYRRTVTNVAPTVTTAGNSTYTFSSATIVGQPTDWTTAIPSAASGAYLWVLRVTAASVSASYVFANTLWGSPTLFSQDGINGTSGSNIVRVFAYKRSASVPADNPGNIDYNFTTNTITTTPLANSWSASIPAGADPLYVVLATAASTTSTDAILAAEWSAPVVLASNGANGTAGINSATVFLYARNISNSSAPAVVTTGSATYTFSNGVLTGTIPTGWTQALPALGTNTALWVIIATAASNTATDTILNTEWSAPAVLAEKGTTGSTGTRGSRDIYLSDVAYTAGYVYNANAAGAASYAVKATDTIASVTAGSVPTTPITGDTVTFTNGSTYVYTITYNTGTTSWNPPGTVIDGSLLVTGSITAAKIDTRGLSIKDTAGNTILTAGASVAASTLNIPGTVSNVPAGWQNSNVSISSAGTLSGGGGGTVTITGLGYTGALNATANKGTTGTLAARPTTNAVGDTHYATDTKLLYVCTAAPNTWTAGASNNLATTGTLASRPTTNAVGDAYYATDTKLLYVCTTAPNTWTTGASNNLSTTGTLAGRPATNAVGDSYYATDTKLLYVCTTAPNTWTAGASNNLATTGTLASRPTTNAIGDTYYATDTRLFYVCTAVPNTWSTGASNNLASSGTLASRPTTNAVGDTYYATDTALFYVCTAVPNTWATGANNYTNTNQLTDGALLGQTAAWASVSNIPYDKIYATDATTTLGFNPSFEAWASSYPDGWSNWIGAVPTKETTIVRFGSNAVKYTAAGTDLGMIKQVSWATAPMPLGTFVSGTLDIYLQARTAGLPGMLVRLFTNPGLSTFVDTPVQPQNLLSAWQRVPFTARVGSTQQIYGIFIYIMASWTGFASGSFTGTVIFDGLTFAFFDSSIDNTSINITGGAITGIGTGSGTPVANSSITVASGVLTGTGTAGVVIDNSYQTIGQNLIPNSDQSQVVCFVTGNNLNSAVFSNINTFASASWDVTTYTLSGITTRNIYIRQTSFVAGGNSAVAIDNYPTGGWGRDFGIPVVPGQRYIWSCYVQGHRCQYLIGLQFWNAAGTATGAQLQSATFQPSGGSTNRLDLYNRPFITATAPSDAVSVTMFVRKFNTMDSAADSYIWYAAPQLEAVSVNAQGPSPYVAGPPASVGQLGYSGALDANKTFVDGSGLIQGVSSGAGTAVSNSLLTSSINSKLAASGAATLTGPVTLGAASAITVGTPALDNIAGKNGFYIGSTGIVATKDGAATVVISPNGDATFKGTVNATSGNFAGSVNTGAYTGYAWPAAGNYGSHLSSSGLLIGNFNNNTYFEINNVGNVYAPGLSIIGGEATFSGNLSSVGGNFTGIINAGQINLTQLVGETFTYTTNINKTNPNSNYTAIRVTAVGGGGGGGASTTAWGGKGGGGGGGKVIATFTSGITGSTVATIAIGAAGNVGGAGGNTTVTINGTTIYANGGGAGGNGQTTEGGSGGGGGGFSGGSGENGLAGGPGGTGTAPYDVYSGGKDPVYLYTVAGVTGSPGSGGVSKMPPNGNGGSGGNAGQVGKVIIEFYNPNGVVQRTEFSTLKSELMTQISGLSLS